MDVEERSAGGGMDVEERSAGGGMDVEERSAGGGMDVEERSAGGAAAVASASGSGAARVFRVSQAWNAGAPLDPPLGSGGCLGHPLLLSHLLSFPISHPHVWGSGPAQRPEPSAVYLQSTPPLHFSFQLPPGLSAPSPSSPPPSPPSAQRWPSARPFSPTPSLSPLRPSSPSSSRPLPPQPAGPAGTRPPARSSPPAPVGLGSAPGPPLPALGTSRRPLGSATRHSLPGPPGQGASLARLAGDRTGSGRPSAHPSGEKLQIRSPGMGPAPLPLLLGLFLPALWRRDPDLVKCFHISPWMPSEGLGLPDPLWSRARGWPVCSLIINHCRTWWSMVEQVLRLHACLARPS
nr:uncharacterized protein LOC117979235 isoform X1 [Pan paniscus]